MNMLSMKHLALVVLAAALVAGCDDKNEYNELTMRHQEKYNTETPSQFFADGMSSRPMVDHAVSADPVPQRPAITIDLVKRGQQRFNIYCSMCHGQDGNGHGMVVEHGFPAPPSYNTDHLRGMPDDYIFRVITGGLGKMPPYAAQIPVEDRWAIVSYVRALEKSQYAQLSDVPQSEQKSLQEGAGR
jgi:mono/diheme cytochrome c family protein